MTDKTDPASVYRWVIVFAVAAMLAIAMGQLVNGLSVFFIPLEQEFGWSRGSIALINSAGLVGLAIGGIVMGGIADRISIKNVSLLVLWLSDLLCLRRHGPMRSGNSICCPSSLEPLVEDLYLRRSSCLSETGSEREPA
jgi:MFS family permease